MVLRREQNGVDKKRGNVRLNRLGGRKMGEVYGGREAEIGGAFQKDKESAGVERSRISRGFTKLHKDRGTSERILGCLTVRASWKSIFIHQSRIVLSFALALSFYIAWVFFLVSAALHATARCILKNRKTHAWSKNVSKNSK